jgi:hypothetical protein
MVLRRPVPFHWLKNGLAIAYKLHWKEFFRFTDSIHNLGVKLSKTNIQAAEEHPDRLTTGTISARKGGTRELTGNSEIVKLDALGADSVDDETAADPEAKKYKVHRAARGRVIIDENLAMSRVLAGWDEAVQALALDLDDEEEEDTAAAATGAANEGGTAFERNGWGSTFEKNERIRVASMKGTAGVKVGQLNPRLTTASLRLVSALEVANLLRSSGEGGEWGLGFASFNRRSLIQITV